MQAIQIRHPYEDVRDTSLFYPLRKLMGVEREGEQPSLKKMSVKVLDRVIQGGAHDPVRLVFSRLGRSTRDTQRRRPAEDGWLGGPEGGRGAAGLEGLGCHVMWKERGKREESEEREEREK